MIERTRERHQPVSGNAPVSRRNPHHTAKRSRLPHRPARIGTQRNHCGPLRYHGSRAAARTARYPVRRYRILHRPISAVLIRRPHRELVAVGLPDDDPARRLDTLHCRRVVGRHIILEDLRSAGGLDPLGHDHIFDRDRRSRQQSRILALCDPLVHLLSSSQRPLRTKPQISVRLRILPLGEIQSLARQFHRAEFPRGKPPPNRPYAMLPHRSITFGTLKYPPLVTGAFATANSFPSGARSTSGRSVAVSSASKST